MADFVITKIEKRFGADVISQDVLSVTKSQDLEVLVN
jgi:hypothetical protein